MTDHNTIWVNNLVWKEEILKNDYLTFSVAKVNNLTGEVISREAIYKKLKFTVFKKMVKIEGSLHYYFNNGEHNYNDFLLSNLNEVINDLETKFSLNPDKAQIHGFEFGVNIRTVQNPNDVLFKIINYKKYPMNKMDTTTPSNGITCKRTDFKVKIYNKSLQNKLCYPNDNILRIEKKIRKMRNIEPLKIKSLNDLRNPDILLSLGITLVKMIDHLIFIEDINLNDLNDKEKSFYKDACNPKYWEALSPQMRFHNLAKYDDLIKKHCDASIKNIIKTQASEKWLHLLSN